VGTAVVGWTRVGVYTERWERLFAGNGAYKSLVWRRLKYLLAPDTELGYVFGGYDESAINGLIVEKGGNMPSFAWGIIVKKDAVLFTLDPVGVRGVSDDKYPDQVKDGNIVYEVVNVDRHDDPNVGGLAFYLIQLNKLELFVEE
jgi:hypothetical protein